MIALVVFSICCGLAKVKRQLQGWLTYPHLLPIYRTLQALPREQARPFSVTDDAPGLPSLSSHDHAGDAPKPGAPATHPQHWGPKACIRARQEHYGF